MCSLMAKKEAQQSSEDGRALKKTDLAEMGVIAVRFYKDGKHEYETRLRKLNRDTPTAIPAATFFQRLYKVAIPKAMEEQGVTK